MAAVTLLSTASPSHAQQVPRENNALRITAVDSGAFPTVTVRVLTTTAGSAPIGDLTRLVLRENGVPIPDTTTAQTPVGVDLALVIDANADFLLFDDNSGLSRRDKVAAGISRYAEHYMNPAGLDRVSLIVPDEAGQGGTFLAQDANRPSDLADAVNAYSPLLTGATPLQAMLTAAIDHLAGGADGRFQAVLLFTDGARLDRQLDYPALTAAALAARIPLYVAILGADASAEETANADSLSLPTNGLTLHMPEPEAADPLYALFQAQGQQTALSYRSALREDGTQQVSVSLGNVRDTASFDLALAPPELSLGAPASPVRRAGSAIDTPLSLLQPAALPLTVRIVWPDGRPRALAAITFRVDGEAQPTTDAPSPDGAGNLPLLWDISARDAGTYRLEVEVVDELGLRAAAPPLEVTLEVARPSPPTPTPAPTRAPALPLDQRLGRLWPVVVAAVLLPVVAAGVWWLRRRARPVAAAEPSPGPSIVAAEDAAPVDGHVAVLSWQPDDGDGDGEQIELTATDITIGRDETAVDIIVDAPSISRLHARIRRTAEGEYWLYDEGSEAGTFLNYERLGLAPRPLQHNDVVQLGRVTLRFRLELPRPTLRAAADDR
ncbi:MAG: FHA domain-containing protein [Candidatus Promineofilum sp.]|nr:FHA domain-containing protein [Promineifilum sp.]